MKLPENRYDVDAERVQCAQCGQCGPGQWCAAVPVEIKIKVD